MHSPFITTLHREANAAGILPGPYARSLLRGEPPATVKTYQTRRWWQTVIRNASDRAKRQAAFVAKHDLKCAIHGPRGFLP